MGTIEKEALQKAVDQEIVIQKVESTENGSCTFFEKYPEMAPFAEKVPEFVRIVFAMKPSADSNIHGGVLHSGERVERKIPWNWKWRTGLYNECRTDCEWTSGQICCGTV